MDNMPVTWQLQLCALPLTLHPEVTIIVLSLHLPTHLFALQEEEAESQLPGMPTQQLAVTGTLTLHPALTQRSHSLRLPFICPSPDLFTLQEEAESQLPGMPTQQPPATAVSRKGTHFADSVRRIEDEPRASRVGGLTTPVLVVMMASLAYLVQTLQVCRVKACVKVGKIAVTFRCAVLTNC
jgi:hypothetical protein